MKTREELERAVIEAARRHAIDGECANECEGRRDFGPCSACSCGFRNVASAVHDLDMSDATPRVTPKAPSVKVLTIFAAMIGRTMAKIDGLENGSGRATLHSAGGAKFSFYHEQECCETCRIEDVVGDVADLIGSPILVAEEISSTGAGEPEGGAESYTWTFYRFATVKGTVTVRWLGESNGYYSESVTYRQVVEGITES